MHKNLLLQLGAGMALLFGAVGCSDDDTPNIPNGDGGISSAALRFAHFVPGGPAVRACVYQNGSVLGPFPEPAADTDGLAYKEASDFDNAAVDPDMDYQVRIFTVDALGSAGCPTNGADGGVAQPVATGDITAAQLEANTFYTVAVLGGDALDVQVYREQSGVDLDDFQVRGVNALVSGSADGPAVTFCLDAIADVTAEPLGDQLSTSFGEATEYEQHSFADPADVFAVLDDFVGSCAGADDGDNDDSERIAESADFAAAGESLTAYLVGDTTSSENDAEFVILRL